MRLLYIDENFSFPAPPKVYDGHRPRYAILSHTWHPDSEEEVTYQDLVNGTGRHKSGWQKLKFCAHKAKEYGLRFCWIDTCCIDKTNSTELNEAIPSMFQWYRDSSVCIVWLQDVTFRPSPYTQPSLRDSKTELSRWFGRGWTLQELIAPREVVFYDQNQRYIGTKANLAPRISDTTRIPKEILNGAPLSDYGIDVRFSWLHGRSTKRPEDMAYCLLGIFNIRMRPDYGEGMDVAFSRLRRKIYKSQSTSERMHTGLRRAGTSFRDLVRKADRALYSMVSSIWQPSVESATSVIDKVRYGDQRRANLFTPVASATMDMLQQSYRHLIIATLAAALGMLHNAALGPSHVLAGIFSMPFRLCYLLIATNLVCPPVYALRGGTPIKDGVTFVGTGVFTGLPASIILTGVLRDLSWLFMFDVVIYQAWLSLHCYIVLDTL